MPASTLGNFQNVTYLTNTGSATPSAAGEATMIVPANQEWRMINFHAKLVTSATVATRAVAIQIIDAAGNVVTEVGAGGATQAASLTEVYNFQAGANGVGAQGQEGGSGSPVTVVGSLPSDTYLLPGWSIKTNTLNLSSGDQYSAVTAYVEIFTV